MKKSALATFVATFVSAVLVTLAPSAQAAARNGVCDVGEFCLYFNSNQGGSVSDFTGSDGFYGEGPDCAKFLGPGTGRGACVKNNAASVWNRAGGPVTVFYKSGHAGSIQTFFMGEQANLNSRLNKNNASHLIGDNADPHLEFGLYKGGGRISTYFDGYISQAGRHEGIDFAKGLGAPVYSLTGGVVTRVEGSGLHTIAIYSDFLDATVIYLHAQELQSLNVGDVVARGAQIATENSHQGGSAHTHVEMRPRRQTHASDSTDDPVLNNPNPTTWWRDRGYNICCS